MEEAYGPTEASNARDYAEASHKSLYNDLVFLAKHLGVVLPSQQAVIDARKKLRDDFLVLAERLGVSAPDDALAMWNALIHSPASITVNWTKAQMDLVNIVRDNTKRGGYRDGYWDDQHWQMSLRHILQDSRWNQ